MKENIIEVYVLKKKYILFGRKIYFAVILFETYYNMEANVFQAKYLNRNEENKFEERKYV